MMYEVREGAIELRVEYVRKGREETVIGKGLTAGSSPPYQ
jgi:acyl-coenzyme A thioesterase PaaI-like protein